MVTTQINIDPFSRLGICSFYIWLGIWFNLIMKKIPKHPFANFVEQIPIVAAKGFVAWLPLGLFLEIVGIDLLAGTTIQTHFWEYAGAIFAVGLPLHFFIWKT